MREITIFRYLRRDGEAAAHAQGSCASTSAKDNLLNNAVYLVEIPQSANPPADAGGLRDRDGLLERRHTRANAYRDSHRRW